MYSKLLPSQAGVALFNKRPVKLKNVSLIFKTILKTVYFRKRLKLKNFLKMLKFMSILSLVVHITISDRTKSNVFVKDKYTFCYIVVLYRVNWAFKKAKKFLHS